MKTEAKKKTRLSTVPEAALEEAGLAKETILAAIPMDGVVLVTKDSMPIVELLQMLDRLNLYAAEMLTARSLRNAGRVRKRTRRSPSRTCWRNARSRSRRGRVSRPVSRKTQSWRAS